MRGNTLLAAMTLIGVVGAWGAKDGSAQNWRRRPRGRNVKAAKASTYKRTWTAKLLSKKWKIVKPGTRAGARTSMRLVGRRAKALKLRNTIPGFGLRKLRVGKKNYHRIDMFGAGRTTKVGYPELPVIKKLIHLPLGSRLVVKNLRSKWKIFSKVEVYPAQYGPEDTWRAKMAPWKRNSRAYASKVWYPSKIVKVGERAIIRGQQVVTLYVYPVQYNARLRKIRVHRDITYDTAFVGRAPTRMIVAAARRFSPAFAPLLAAQVLAFRPPAPKYYLLKPVNRLDILLALKGCDYLIITKDAYYDALTPLVTHKQAKGLIVRRTKLSSIAFRPTADQIRNYIKTYYETFKPAPTYVLLVGDANIIPPHYKTDHPRNSELKLKMGTDLYYGCVDGMDKIPDIFVGRLPAKTVAHVTSMVSKIIAWEKAIGQDAAWTRKMLLASYFQDRDPTDGRAERDFLQTIERIRSYFAGQHTEGGKDFSLTRVYQATAGSPARKRYRDGTAVPAGTPFVANGTQNILNAINNEVGFIWHRDHGDSRNGPNGGSDGWSEPVFTSGHMGQVNNDHPFVAFSINCRTGWFDGETDKDTGATKVNCLAEALIKRPSPKGAATVIGSTRNSPSYPNNDLTLGIIEAIYPGIIPTSAVNAPHDPIYSLGPALTFAKNYVRLMWGGLGDTDVVREYEMYNILGDPDLQMRYRKPAFLSIHTVLHRPWLAKLLKRRPLAYLRAVKIKPRAYLKLKTPPTMR